MGNKGGGTMDLAAFTRAVRGRVQATYPGWSVSRKDDETLRIDGPAGWHAELFLGNFYEAYRLDGDLARHLGFVMHGLARMAESRDAHEALERWENARERLVVRLAPDYGDEHLPPEHRRVGLPWQADLRLYPVLDFPDTLTPLTGDWLRRYDVTLAEAVRLGSQRIRERLAVVPPTDTYDLPGAHLAVWDNALPGYDATRAAWPEAVFGDWVPGEHGYGIVAAPDRDYCIAVRLEDYRRRETLAAVAVLAELARTRAGQPRRAMGPGLAFYTRGGAYTYYDNQGVLAAMLAREHAPRPPQERS